jgi:dihydrofolate reductase
MLLSIIVAMDNNNCIGNNNTLLWKIPADMKFFKETTTGHAIVMGKNTFLSIGKPLPNRRNIIITRNKDFKFDGAEVYNSPETIVELFKDSEEEVFVIGGGEIYKRLLPFVTKLYVTHVHASFLGDTFFPEISQNVWKKTSSRTLESSELNPHPLTFAIYKQV